MDLLQRISGIDAGRTSLRGGSRDWTFGELRTQAEILAVRIDSTHRRIGVFIESTEDRPWVLLGVLLSGATYVPLDPSYPPDRLRLSAEIAELDLVIVDRSASVPNFLGDHWPSHKLLCLDALALEDVSPSPALSWYRSKPQDAAYIIFTSGSTGKPKAVEMSFAALDNLLTWQSKQTLGKPARVLQLTPIGFDVHFQEIFHTWSDGGCLQTVDDELRRDPRALLEFIREAQVERLYLPFVALNQLTSAASTFSTGALPNLRDVVTAGEQLVITDSVRDFFKKHTNCRLHNQYGPSETHVVTAYSLTSEVSSWPRTTADRLSHRRLLDTHRRYRASGSRRVAKSVNSWWAVLVLRTGTLTISN